MILFRDDTSSIGMIDLSCSYFCSISNDKLEIELPVLLILPFSFRIAADYSVPGADYSNSIADRAPMVSDLTSALEHWFLEKSPITTNGRLLFTIELFPKIDEPNLPPVHLPT